VRIHGESGTGKELVADALGFAHASKRPIAVNCAALPESVFESLLFGHTAGAFTGAKSDHVGYIEAAHGGDLFLDEIAELPLWLQAKLLRALESKTIQRLGGTRLIAVDFRLIVATHADLEALSAAGRFRQDLYYRLGPLTIRLPPLRERQSDLRDLALHFLKGWQGPQRGKALSDAALEKLMTHDWPGNVRELKHVLDKAVVDTDGLEIQAEAIELPKKAAVLPALDATLRRIDNLPAELEAVERAYCERAMAEHEGNAKAAAESLGIPRSTLRRRLKEWGL